MADTARRPSLRRKISRKISCSLDFLRRSSSYDGFDDRPKSRKLFEGHGNEFGYQSSYTRFDEMEQLRQLQRIKIGDFADELDSRALRKVMESAEKRRDHERRRSLMQMGFRLAHLTGRESARSSLISSNESEMLVPGSSTRSNYSPMSTQSAFSHSSENEALSEVPVEVGIRVGEFDSRLRKPYIYSPLQSNRVIRLLSVRRPSVDWIQGDFYYQLVTMSLDDPVPFETVSYIWGDSRREHRLNLMDGSFLFITRSLAATLQSISNQSKTGYLWIDQVCIDQANLPERSHQVAVMGDIYRAGIRVIAPLKPPQVRMRHLFTLLDVAVQHENEQKSVVDLQTSIQQYMLPSYSTSIVHSIYWKCVVSLLEHPWFTRAWIFQEVVLSENVLFLFGERLISFDLLFRLALATSRLETDTMSGALPLICVTNLSGFHQLFSMVQARSERHVLGNSKNFWSLLSEVAPNSRCTDGRDKFYGFVGLLEDEDIIIRPDYKKGPHEVFIDSARSYIEGKSSLEILSLLPRQGRTNSQYEGIPSWVPDWRQPEDVVPLTAFERISAFNACMNRPYKVLNEKRISGFRPLRLLNNRLRVEGRVIDTITNVEQEAFSCSQHWTKRDLRKFLNLELALLFLKGLWDTDAEYTLERVLKVVTADGALLYDTLEFSQNAYLQEAELTEMAQAYRQFDSPENFDGEKFQLAPYARNVVALRNMTRVAQERRLVVGRDGKLGLVHNSVVNGDLVVILNGSRTPLILTPRTDGRYECKGQCYWEGAMHGQAVTWEEDEAEEMYLV
jgi:hypothetical protein